MEKKSMQPNKFWLKNQGLNDGDLGFSNGWITWFDGNLNGPRNQPTCNPFLG